MVNRDDPGPRIAVLLGASNLAMGLPSVLRVLRRQRPGPLRVFAARGHGRSYGSRSRVLWRELPGILDCGLWSALSDQAAGSHPDAVVTDIGNDLVYGATPATLIGWVETCVDRLERIGARILVTRLPVASLERLSRARFEVVRRLFFPSYPLEFDQMIDGVRETDDRVATLARRRGIAIVGMDPAWYGLDPVHFRIRRRRAAWSTILAAGNPPETGQARARPGTGGPGIGGPGIGHAPAGPDRGEAAGTAAGTGHAPVSSGFPSPRWARPERWWFAGRPRGHAQPARRLADGSELWLY